MLLQTILTWCLTTLDFLLRLQSSSSNPLKWVQHTSLPNENSNVWQAVTYGNGRFVAVSQDMPASIGAVSFNGLTWKEVFIPCSNPTMTGAWNGITYANGKFITISGIAGDGATGVAVSSDGINWKNGTLPSPQIWWKVAGGNGLFVAIVLGNVDSTNFGPTNITAVSSDGLHWTQIELPVSNTWESISFGNGVFVIIGTENVSVTSKDGRNWQYNVMPVTNLQAVTYAQGVFVATSSCIDCNQGAVSHDGVHWNATKLPKIGYWNAIAYGSGLFVASGLINDTRGSLGAVSYDGINWNETVLPSLQNWNAIAYGNNTFVALSSIGGYVARATLIHEED